MAFDILKKHSVFILLLLSIVIFSLWEIRGNYAIADDFSFFVMRSIDSLDMWLTIARPGNYIFFWVVAHILNWNLVLGRFLAVFLAIIASITTYTALLKKGHSKEIALAAALAIPGSFTLQLSFIWVNVGSSTLAVLLAALSYYYSDFTKRQIILSTTLICLGMLTYGPAASIYFILCLLDVLSKNINFNIKESILNISKGIFSLVTMFACSRLSIYFLGPSWASHRATITTDPLGKLNWLWNTILPIGASPVFPPLAHMNYLFILMLSWVVFLRFKAINKKKSDVFLFFFIVLSTLFLSIAIILVASDNWASSRTLVPLSMLVFSLIAYVIKSIGSYLKNKEKYLHLIISSLILFFSISNVVILRRYIVDIQIKELQYVINEIKTGYSKGEKHFCFVYGPIRPVIVWDKTYTHEFVWPSSSKPWTAEGFFRLAVDQAGINKNEVSLIKFGEMVPKKSDCYFIEMKKYWNKTYEDLNQNKFDWF